MIINKLDNITYQIKLPYKKINIYDEKELKILSEKILKKIIKSTKLNKLIILDIYVDKMYGTIIIVRSYKNIFNIAEYEVKIHIHSNPHFLYKIDYFNIKKNILKKEKIYYYNNNFYLELNNYITKKEYLDIIEKAELIYEDTEDIINKAIKM